MRSPNYPSVILADAIERLRPVYAAVHTYSTPKPVFLENMGYSASSGVGLSLIATLKRYGLVEMEGGHLRITDRAVAILELPNGPERATALRDAAFAPALFSELHAEFPNELPGDGLLRHHLIKKGFLPKAADEIIRVFRANLELVEEKRGEYNPPMPDLSSPPQTDAFRPKPPGQQNVVAFNEKFLPQWEYRFKVSRDTDAKVIFIGGEATQEAVEKLSELLRIQKDTFPTEAELQQVEKESTE